MKVGEYQIIFWPRMNFGRWNYPRRWARDKAIFKAWLVGFIEIRKFNEHPEPPEGFRQ